MGRAHLARSRIDSYKKRIQTCENYKKQFVNQLQELKNKCLNREISYEEYKNLASKKQGDKTCEEWISYYDSYIKESKEIIETERKIIARNNMVSSIASFFFISLFILLFATQGGKIIGFVIQDSSQEYSEELNLHFENSSTYEWHPNIKGQLISLQISGKILGEGSAKIYLDNILILDSNSIQTENSKSLLTGFSIQTGYNPESTDNTQTKEKEADSSEEEVSPSPSEPASAPNEIIDLNETEQKETIELNQTEEELDENKVEKTFIKHCEESCNLEDLLLDYQSYPLKIELDNSEIQIQSITYKIRPFENNSEINHTLELNNTLEINQTENNKTLILNDTQIINNTSQLKIIKEIPDFRVSKKSSLNMNLKEYFENANNYSLLTENLENSLNNHNLSIIIPFIFTQERVKIIAYSENESLESNEFTILTQENTINITKTRGKIRIGQPVKWTTNISLNSVENLTITLPEEARNIEINEVNPQTEEISLSPITGNIIKTSNSNNNFIKRFFQKLRSAFTGYAISDSTTEKEKPETNIILDDNSKEYIIEYETEAPTSEEKINLDGKEITISAPDELHYTDVIASTNILDSEKITSSSQISLIWYNYEYNKNISIKSTEEIKENVLLQEEELPVSNIPYLNLELNFSENQENKKDYQLESMPFDSYDLNGDGNLDYLEWVVPHLSNQSFRLYLTRENSTTPGNNISIEGVDGEQYSHLSTDKTSSAHQISYNLIAYFPFDKDDSTTIYDFANDYNGTKNGDATTTATNCIINNCLTLDGTGDYITGSALPIDWTNRNWSASVWARLDADASAGIGIFTNRPGNANWMTLGYTSQNFIGVEINGGTQIDTTINPAGQGWQYYTLVKNDSGLGLYINTTYYHLTNTPGDIGAPDTQTDIGDWFNGGQTWKGALDEFMFFNTSLNDTQVSQIYQNTSIRYASSGIQETKFFTVNPNVNNFNLSLQNYERKFGTNISARIGTWDISKDYNTSDLNNTANSLIAYYNFDNQSSLGENRTLFVDRKGKHNGTILGGNITITNPSVFGQALQFDGVDDYATIPIGNTFNFSTNNFTISWWEYREAIDNGLGSIVRDSTDSTPGFLLGYTDGTAVRTVYMSSGGVWDIASAQNLGDVVLNSWQYLTVTRKGSTFRAYSDGVQTSTWESELAIADTSLPMQLGKYTSATDYFFKGVLDEVMIFNRSLSTEEIKELHVKGRALWTFTDYQNLTARNTNDNWSLNNFTIPTTTTHILPNFMLVSDSNRFFTPILQATTTNPANVTTDYLITSDTTAPIVTINFPANTTYGNIHLPLMFNVSLNEQGSARYSLDNGLNNFTLLNSSGGTLGTLLNRSNGSISAGSYNFKVYANDTSGNQNNTVNVTFSIELTSPVVSIINPQPAFYNVSSITFNVSLNENGSVWYSLNSGLNNYSMTSNATGTGFNATNSSIGDGTYNFKVYANDTAGNTNLTLNRTFYVDTTKPAISFIGNTPADSSTQTTTSIVVNVSSNGSLSGSSDPDHYVLTNFDNSLVGWWTMDNINGSGDPIDLTGINNGSAIGGASQNSSVGSGRFGKSFTLAGDNDEITIPYSHSLNATKNITLAAWVYQNSWNGWPGIIGKSYQGTGSYSMHIRADNVIWFELEGTVYTSGATNLTNSRWEHVVGTYDGSTMRIYINGIEAGTGGAGPANRYGNNQVTWIGHLPGAGYFNGMIDEAMIFNRSLSLAEVKALYNASANKYYNNFTGLSISNHTFTSYAVDSAGNRNSTSRTVTINEVTNTAPIITNVTISSSFSITENSFTAAKLNFTVYDADGFTDINGSNAKAQFNRTLETTRKDPACINTANWSTNYANFSCTVNIWYFDGSGDWTVNASIGDLSSANTVNQTVLFTLGQTSAFVTSPGNLTFSTLSRGGVNQTANNDPLLLNNTGNKNITAGNVQINATDLIGETNAAYGIWAGNISVGIFTGGSAECDLSVGGNASSMNKSYFQPINQSILMIGNHSANDGSTGQEQLYFCIRTIGTENIGQAYSPNITQGPWTIKILAVAFAFGSLSRNKKKITKDKLVKALIIIKEEVRKEESKARSEVMSIISEEIQDKYDITKQELFQIINEHNNESIPVSIFKKNLGGLEAVCKYLKENKGLSYVEIARLLNRDQRTIWTAYKKANKKLNIILEIEQDAPLLPISFLGNREHTIIESSIIYLKERGLRYVEIARLLNRDQRNICSTYKKAIENRREKGYIASQ